MLHLVARVKGEASAKLAQLAAEYDPQPPFGGIDRSGVGSDPVAMPGAPRAFSRQP